MFAIDVLPMQLMKMEDEFVLQTSLLNVDLSLTMLIPVKFVKVIFVIYPEFVVARKKQDLVEFLCALKMMIGSIKAVVNQRTSR